MNNRLEHIGSRSGDAYKVADHLYTSPIIDVQTLSIVTGKSLKPAYNLMALLERLEIVKEITGAQRSKLYMFSGYVQFFKS
ncbi:MAG TPA: hypothetical protein PLL71_02760 [Agriterribacter sp.]|nr:hypothetical protein [Agriterribacter sp.]